MRIQNELLAKNKRVPFTKLCGWLALPRSTAYYQSRQRSAFPMKKSGEARLQRQPQPSLHGEKW